MGLRDGEWGARNEGILLLEPPPSCGAETQTSWALQLSGAVLLMIHLVTRGAKRVSRLIRFTVEIHPRARGDMTTDEQVSKMKRAIAQAIKVMGHRFGSTEQDVARAIQELKESMQGSSESSLSENTVPGPGSQAPQATTATIKTESRLQTEGA
jgi:hypothetical protein